MNYRKIAGIILLVVGIAQLAAFTAITNLVGPFPPVISGIAIAAGTWLFLRGGK